MSTPETAPKRKPSNLLARCLLLAAVVAAPWPFGSVVPLAVSALSVFLVFLYVSHAAIGVARSGSLPTPPGLAWILGGLTLVAVQCLPLPHALVALAAPAAGDAYAPLGAELGVTGWHPLSVEPFETVQALALLVALACAYALSNRLFSRRWQDPVVYSLAAVGVALSLFAVYQKARFGNVLYGRFQVESATPFGPFVNHNHFAGYVEACLLVTLGAALMRWKRDGSLALLLGGAAALMGIGHVLSHSRGGLVALGCGVAFLAWLSRGDEWKGARIFLVGGGLAVLSFLLLFAPSTLYQRLATLGAPGKDDSVRYRLQLWSDSIALWERSPVAGTGLGTYSAAIPRYRSGPDETRAEYAESDWIQLLSETGVAGMIVAAGFLVSVLFAAHRRLRKERSETIRGAGYGALAAAVALVAHGFVDFNFRIPSNALLFALVLGMAAPRGRQHRLEVSPRWRSAVAALGLALAASLAIYVLRLGVSEHRNQRVNPLLTDPEEFTGLIQDLVRSREAVPANPQSWFLLGRLYNEEAYRSRDAVRYRELRLEQARAAFRQALRLAPARGRFWFELGWTEAALENDGVADRLFSLALEREPHWADLRANYALFLVSRGRVNEALTQLEIGRKLEPGISPGDALDIIGPYLGDDAVSLRELAGEDPEGERALAAFRSQSSR
jgi:O-antigen ligase